MNANQWRRGEILRIDHQLGLHWTRTVLGAIEHGEPLAHGLDRLRETRAFLATTPGADPRQLATVDEALSDVRGARLRQLAAGHEPPRHLLELLGPVPEQPAMRDTWLALADRAEATLDAGRADDAPAQWRALLAAAKDLPAPMGPDGPERWTATLDQAVARRHVIEQQRRLERDVGLSL